MIEDCGVRPEGCLRKPNSDISTNMWNKLSEFRYITLGEILLRRLPQREV